MELRLSRSREAEDLIGLGERLASVACCNRVSALRVITSGPRPARVDIGDSIRPEGYPPGQFANLNGLDNAQRRHVDDGDIVRNAVGNQQVFFVGREGTMPNPLSDQEILDRKSTRLNSSHEDLSRMPSSA